ncbi:hypothetical protein NMY22_g18267 [Coprinellus aureogranulatus]|nr:hypothetical protein NMY22_g18267 [Coprinellus aureogranulatus]
MPRLGFGVYQNYSTKDSVLLALEAGYRHIDTAQAYKSEAHVADAVRQSGIPREKVFITTKIISKFHGYDKTTKGVKESLERMQLDYIDLFLIHNPHAGTALRLETYRALLDARSAGLIHSIGVSNYGIHHLQEIKDAGLEKPSVNQIELHPYCQQRDIVEYCKAEGIVVQAYCPILRGNMEDPVFDELAEKYGRDKAQILLRWSLQKGFVPLPKSATPSRIVSNTHLYDYALSDNDMERIDALDKPGREGCLTWNPVDDVIGWNAPSSIVTNVPVYNQLASHQLRRTRLPLYHSPSRNVHRTIMSNLTLNSTVKLSSGYDLPLLGFGVYQNDDATPGVLEALKAGYRHVDSAQMYRNEAQVGEALRKSGIPREEVFITTKVASAGHGYESTKKGIDESLKRFGFDYIDLFLIHDPLSGKDKRLETYKALLGGKAAGKIRSVGVSNYGVHHLKEIEAAGYEKPSVNQIELHPLCQQKDIVAYCKEHGIVVEAYCPIIRGEMDKPAIQELAKKYQRDPAQILLRWSLQKGYVPLPKSATPSRIHSNAKLYNFELTAEDIAKLDALDQGADGAISWNPVNAP